MKEIVDPQNWCHFDWKQAVSVPCLALLANGLWPIYMTRSSLEEIQEEFDKLIEGLFTFTFFYLRVHQF